jgi:hypothetical protein
VNIVHAEPQIQTIGGLWTLEVWVSRLRGHPEGPEALSAGCSTVVPGFNVLGIHGSAGADGLIKELEGQILLQAQCHTQLLESLEIMERQSEVIENQMRTIKKYHEDDERLFIFLNKYIGKMGGRARYFYLYTHAAAADPRQYSICLCVSVYYNIYIYIYIYNCKLSK